MKRPDLSLVIPVYNGASSIGGVVQDIVDACKAIDFEIILVNDGSKDATEKVCRGLADAFPSRLTYLHLSRNFSEHNAVLAGLNQSRGHYVAVLDDDGQNPPSEALRLYQHSLAGGYDTVYGYYEQKQHHWFRNLGSRFNDRVANVMLKKPPHIYLSSFKVMSRFVVDQVIRYHGAFPYIDGLIFRTTQNISQISVQHKKRVEGQSGYTFKKLVSLWMNMFLNFSIGPLRLAAIFGLITALATIPLIILVIIDKFFNPGLTLGVPTILVVMTFFAGVQLLNIGLVGEYLGRLFLDHSGMPQFVVRYAYGSLDTAGHRSPEPLRSIPSLDREEADGKL